MLNPFKEFLVEKKEEEESKAIKPKKLDLFNDLENVEIKKLTLAELEEVHIIMRKTLWEVSKQQIANVLSLGMSYGAYVERMLVGAGLAWTASYDEKKKNVTQGEPNAIYLEDVALLLAYEGRGIRQTLIKEREKYASANDYVYTIGYISPDWPRGNLEDMIKERGNRIEKAYLTDGYKFVRTKEGILAVKHL